MNRFQFSLRSALLWTAFLAVHIAPLAYGVHPIFPVICFLLSWDVAAFLNYEAVCHLSAKEVAVRGACYSCAFIAVASFVVVML